MATDPTAELAEQLDNRFVWNDQTSEYIASDWGAFITQAYYENQWFIVLSQPMDVVLSSMNQFKKIFPPMILLAIWVVLLLSNVQIRRSLDPIAKLSEGTRRLAMRDFSEPVQVATGDEFEDLANSFNTMGRTLRQQFSAMTAMNEIDRVVLSALDRERIIDTVLARTRDVLACDGVSIALAPTDGDGGASLPYPNQSSRAHRGARWCRDRDRSGILERPAFRSVAC